MKEFPDKRWNRSALDYLLVKIDATGSADRRKGSGKRADGGHFEHQL